MKYTIVKKRIIDAMNSEASTRKKYLRLRQLFAKMFEKKTPLIQKTAKEKVQDVTYILEKIIQDEEFPSLFRQISLSNAKPENTFDFIEFLKKASR